MLMLMYICEYDCVRLCVCVCVCVYTYIGKTYIKFKAQYTMYISITSLKLTNT